MGASLLAAILGSVTLTLFGAPAAQAKTIALLVGIGRYPEEAHRLDGPPYDVAAMKTALTTYFGAQPGDVKTLLDAEATRGAILTALGDLKRRSAPGDWVVIYFSGHGTSARDRHSNFDLPYGTGAFIPYDATLLTDRPWSERLIIGRSDLAPSALKPLDEGGRHVLVIVDACYSGRFVRNVTKGRDRYIALGAGADEFAEPGRAAAGAGPEVEPPFPYRNVVMLAAASDYETAKETSDPAETFDGKPQGVFTNALMRVFRGEIGADMDGDGKVSFRELRDALETAISAAGYPQSPQLLPSLSEDSSGITIGPAPGAPARRAAAPSTSPIRVSLGPGAEDARAALAQSGFVIAPDGGDFTLDRIDGQWRLSNRTGDLVFASVHYDALGDRLAGEALARRIARGADPRLAPALETEPAHRGGTFQIGRDALQILARGKGGMSLLLLDLQPAGRLTVLYPTRPGEGVPAADDGVLRIPERERILATPPAGLDHVLAIAFPKTPEGIERFFELNDKPGSKAVSDLETWLSHVRGGYGAASIEIRTIAGSGQ